MNFTEAVQQVISITKRPDKVLDIQREVNRALNLYCIEGTFARDRDEQVIVLNASAYVQSIALSSLPRFRKVDAIILPYSKKPLTPTDPSKLFSKEGCDESHTFYLSGDSIHIKLSQTAADAKVSYFKYPPILTNAAGTFWLLDVSPYMVIDKAAGAIFSNIGDDASARTHIALADIAYNSAKRDYKYGVNYG